MVATDVGGVSDVVSSVLDGELVIPENESAYAAALARASERRRRLPSERSSACRDHYSIRRLVSNMEDLYTELLDGSKPRAAA